MQSNLSTYQEQFAKSNGKLPEPIKFGSDWSKYPMPGQQALDLKRAGYAEAQNFQRGPA